MRTISNAQLASAARLAMLEGRLGALKGLGGLMHFPDGSVCAIGAALTVFEGRYFLTWKPSEGHSIRRTSAKQWWHGPMVGIDLNYADQLADAHDDWARAVEQDRPAVAAMHRAKLVALLDLHDPVKKLERESQPVAAAPYADEGETMEDVL